MDLTRYKGEYIERPTPGELAQMVRDGARLDDLADDFGCSVATLRRDLYNAGYKPTGATMTAREPDDDLAALAAVVVPGPWVDDALCAQVDTEMFFPEKGGSTRQAKAICARCPVADECLDYALANNERFGIWGGSSERDRRRLTGRTSVKTCPECGERFTISTGSNSITYCGGPCRRAARAKHDSYTRTRSTA